MENYHLNGWKNCQNGKDSPNDHLQGDQRSKVPCEDCNNDAASIMIWECFSFYGVRSIYHIPGIMV